MTARAAPVLPTDVLLEMVIAASYARKSTSDDALIKAQHQVNTEKAQASGCRIPDASEFKFEDDNTTGASTRRKGLDRLLDLVQSGHAPFQRVYVRDLTRLSRVDFAHVVYIYFVLKQRGIELWDAESNTRVDFSDENIGQTLSWVMNASYGSQELKKIARRTHEGRRERLLSGFFPGLPPFATERYLADRSTGTFIEKAPDTGSKHLPGAEFKLRWDPQQLWWVNRIFEAIEEGASLREIARTLNLSGVSTPLACRQQKPSCTRWRAGSVSHVLRNPLYMGTLVWGFVRYRDVEAPVMSSKLISAKGPVSLPGFLADPPISREQWHRVQGILDVRRARTVPLRRAGIPINLLTGRLRCANCGTTYSGTSFQAARRYYRHGRATDDKPEPCRHRNRYFSADAIEARVLELLSDVLRDDRLIQLAEAEIGRLTSSQGADERRAELAALLPQEQKLEGRAQRAALSKVEAETATEREMYVGATRIISAQLDQLRHRRAALEAETDQLDHARARRTQAIAKLGNLRVLLTSANQADVLRLIQEAAVSIKLDAEAGTLLTSLVAL